MNTQRSTADITQKPIEVPHEPAEAPVARSDALADDLDRLEHTERERIDRQRQRELAEAGEVARLD